MIDIIISYLPRKVNIAFLVISAWCIMLSRYAHRASADNAADHMTSCRGCCPPALLTNNLSLFTFFKKQWKFASLCAIIIKYTKKGLKL